MSQRPKFLSVITIPTGGWGMKIYVSSVSGAESFDTAVTCTMAAGDYFMSWDNQSDDFLYELTSKLYAALDACAVAHHNAANNDGKPSFTIDSNHKVNIYVNNAEDMKFAWTESNGASIAAVLGFASAADDSFTGTQLVADYHHGYGWYADEDGLLASSRAVDVPSANAMQSTAPSGHTKTHFLSMVYGNEIRLQMLPADKVHSSGIGYGTAPTDPWTRNAPLECWWKEAAQGKRFRFYEDSTIDGSLAEVRGSLTSATTTTGTDTGRAFATDPQEHAGKILQMEDFDDNNNPMRWRISSHTATVLTVPASVHNSALNVKAATYRIFDQRYRTYVLDVTAMPRFAPREHPKIDRYDVTIPVKRYES